MFSLKPLHISATFVCPDCNCKFGQPTELLFLGTNIIADCLCECCENKYYHTVPTGHAALFPISFSQKTTKTKYDEQYGKWLATPLVESVRNNNSVERKITKVIYQEKKEVILLNCLDNCYGHVFFKLLNIQRYTQQYPDKGIVVLVPSSFLWMMPEGVAEIWQVDAKLSDFNKIISNLDIFIKDEIKRFDSVLLSEAPVHSDINKFDLKSFLKTEAFDLFQFEKKSPQITFILREDRFWLNNRIDAFLMRLAVSRGWMKSMKGYFISRQNRLIKKLANEINKKSEGKIKFVAAGLGKTGSLGSLITDLRKESIDEKGEKEWCELYSSSHLVIGIHGSNMLIPTALSAGFIELLPRYKIYNYTEDIAMNRKGRYMQFLGRFMDEFTSVKLVAEHAVSIINWFPVVRRNMEE